MKLIHRQLLATFLFAPFALFVVILFPSCETAPDGTRRLTPEGKQVLRDVGSVVLQAGIAAGTSAAEQYATGGKVDGGKIAAASISGAAYGLRTINPATVTASGVNDALTTYSGDPRLAAQLAPAVTASVQNAVAQGVPPGTALETAASHLDTAAAAVAASKPTAP